MYVLSCPHLPEGAQTPVGSEVYRGLTARPKMLSPWLFYDARGSDLFEQITELPEYYPTRTERSILSAHADQIVAAAAGCERLTMIELGAGTATKTGLLLKAAVRLQDEVTYHAIDVSRTALDEAKRRIEAELEGVAVVPRVGDYTEGLGRVEADGQRRMVLYIGSSIGNFEPEDALQLLRDIRRELKAGEKLLLGVDMIKNCEVLLRAYDDAAGVTAAFNKNVLARINRELGANFNLDLFRHRALWNEERSRIEMHLESRIAQRVVVPALELEVKLQRGETIHTENSYKFRDEGVIEMLERADFCLSDHWTDNCDWFGVYLATAW
ncbi:L-histidine N(alpha)-methyltransferase [Alloacidobacterium sp.]|uniref:L-histidine N(alpha)-methyltransferase n=1 Tax=Alloacidobacterium sp. TaxID=2951999 RepID=UPI002D2B79FF|nr:L-histidine N(alpha)-methyltransferase [Alloacidobacterium sp.]HYK36977.1 L-histidine N(alpha)-methyltransferase [Alloacidobacterium sp.]